MAEIEAHESKIYSEFAPFYDKIFGKIFYNRLERVIEDLDIPPGAKVLEVGAGTGSPFPPIPLIVKLLGSTLRRTCWRVRGKKLKKTAGTIFGSWR